MAARLINFPEMHPVNGIRLGTSCAGIKAVGRRDLVLMELTEGSYSAAVFTQNAFCAAPVILARAHLSQTLPRFLLINTGNANAGTGAQGLKDAQTCCARVAEIAGCAVNEVLPFSTGVIGNPLWVPRIEAALPALYEGLSPDGWEEAAHGILTTDTVPKGSSRRIEIEGKLVTITGIAKGSGMIRPDMATMLAFIATDAAISQELLQACLNNALPFSFNRITVDGDTSSNDACMLIATGKNNLPMIDSAQHPAYPGIAKAIIEVCAELAQAIVRDGEGATKFITVEVSGGTSEAECCAVAYTIAHSPLVKTAFFANDANWGRILAAVGRSGPADFNIGQVTIHLDEACIVRGGERASDYSEEQGKSVMGRDEITVRVDLARGGHSAKVWTCDFSYDYVRINAEYRT